MIKLAKIIEMNEDFVLLKLEKKSQCIDCKSRCSDGFLSFLFHKDDQGLLSVALEKQYLQKSHILDEHHYFSQNNKINELVGLNFNDSHIFKIALLLYGLPILSIIIFLVIGYLIFPNINLSADLGGLTGLVLGLLFSKYFIKLFNRNYKPKVSFFK